jgi:hypothetical protein
MDKRTRASQAAHLMRNPVLLEAFEAISKSYTNAFVSVGASDGDVLEAHRMILALQAVKSQIQTYIVDGKLEERKERNRGND